MRVERSISVDASCEEVWELYRHAVARFGGDADQSQMMAEWYDN